MGFDTSVFMDMNRARTLLLLSELGPHLNLPEEMNRNTFVSSVLVKLSPSLNLRDTVNAILEEHAIKYNLDFVMVAGMISDIAAKLQIFSGFFHIFSATLWGMALIVLALVFSSIIQERKKEFGLLRVIGASRSALAGIVAKEALLVSSLGAACGVFCGALLLALFRTYIEATLELPSISPGLPSLLGTAAGVFLLGALTGPLGCLPAIHTLGRTDAYLAMREEA
jgi:ABC-type antimicrobial peptide transport system, permease component